MLMEKGKRKKLTVIGGIAAGTSAAVKARRSSEDIEITIYEKYKHISYGTCGLPYYVSGKINDIEDLIINTVEQFEKRFNIKVNILNEVIKIDTGQKELTIRDVRTGDEFKDKYDSLIITTGSYPVIVNEDLCNSKNAYSLRTIDDAMRLKELIRFLENKKEYSLENENIKTDSINAVIIGGGYIGLELLDAFLLKGFNVTIIEKMDQLLSIFDYEMIEFLENYLSKRKVNIIKNSEVTDFKKDVDGNLTLVKTTSGEEIPVDVLFFSIGTRPDVRLARDAGIKIGSSGAISVNDSMLTNMPDIYAAGDCCECEDFITGVKRSYNLASIANIQGRVAGYNVTGGNDFFGTRIPTSIIKILDVSIAKTGISLKDAKKLDINAAKIELHFLNHAGYYPGATMMHMMAIYDRDSGIIIGFEAIGFTGIDKKTDTMSVAIKSRMKIWELLDTDLCYHPEYGSAKDSLNIMGMIGENIKKGDVELMDVEELREKIQKKEDIRIIDVRTRREYNMGHIEGAINIPVDELRDNLISLNKSDSIVVHCRTSYRSYLAYRILINEGFKKVWNLNGSYMSWIRKI